MANTVPISEFEYYLTDLVEKEVMNAERTMDEVLTFRAMQIKNKLIQRCLRDTKDTGEYARGWRVKSVVRNHEKVKVIYNAAKPWLTYILEYGNAHQRERPHIRLVLEEEIDEITEELLNKL